MSGSRFSLRTLLLIVTALAVAAALSSYLGERYTFWRWLPAILPFYLAIAATAVTIRSPWRLAVALFLLHAAVCLPWLAWATSTGDRWQRSERIAAMLYMDAPVGILLQLRLDDLRPTAGAYTGVAVMGGAFWSLAGWMVAHLRRSLAICSPPINADRAAPRKEQRRWSSIIVVVLTAILVVIVSFAQLTSDPEHSLRYRLCGIPLHVPLLLAALLIRSPRRLAACFFCMHSVITIPWVYWASLPDDGERRWARTIPLYVMDFPLELTYWRWLENFSDVPTHCLVIPILGGAIWWLVGWMIGHTRRSLASPPDTP